MSVSVAVMAHPVRETMVPPLLEALDAEATVVWDQKQDRWDTGRRSMLAYDPDATHHLVIQDDAIACRDLVAGVTRMVEAVPNHPICLYTGRTRPRQGLVQERLRRAIEADSRWLVMEGPWWGVGVVVPTPLIPAMVAWGDKHPEIKNYDRRMAQHFAGIGLDCYYSIPSLVDHRQDHQSLVPGRKTLGRRAHMFIGDQSPLDLDWTVKEPSPPPEGYVVRVLHSRKTFVCWHCELSTQSRTRIRNHVAGHQEEPHVLAHR